MGKISITNLRLEAIIGFNPEERLNKQPLLISYSIEYNSIKAEKSDDVDDAINYKKVNKSIIKMVESSSFNLIEALTSQILQLIIQDERVQKAVVTVDKGTALRYADSVAFTIEYNKAHE